MARLDAGAPRASAPRSAIPDRKRERRRGKNTAARQSTGAALRDVFPATALRIFLVRARNGLRVVLERQIIRVVRFVLPSAAPPSSGSLLAAGFRERLGLLLRLHAMVVLL